MSLFWLWTVIIFSLRFCNFLRVEAKINKPCLSFCHRHWPYGLEKELRTFNNYTDSWVRIAWQKMATFLATVAKRCEECVGEKMSSSLSMNLTRNSQYLRAKKEKNLGLLSFYLYFRKRAFFLKSVACISFIFSVNASGNRIFICVQFNVHWCIKKKQDPAIYFFSTTSSWSWFMTSQFGFNDQNDPEEILQSYISIIRKQIINVILCT